MKPGRTVMHMTSVHHPYDTRILLKECRSLVDAGYEVHLAAPARSDGWVAGVRLHALPDFRLLRPLRLTITTAAAFRHAYRLRADLYQFHDPELIPVGLLLRSMGRRVVYDAHEDLPAQLLAKPWIPRRLRPSVSRLASYAERIAVRRANATVTAREEVAERIAPLTNRCVLVRNYAWRGEFGPPSDYSEKERSICYVGTISENRGVEQLLRALRGTDIRLLLAGRFTSPAFREQLIAQPGWEQVDELGHLERRDVSDVMRRAQAGAALFLPVPNHVDSEPTKIFEYMAAGLPVIASDLPRMKRIVAEHDCGVCVAPDDPHEVRRAIEAVVDDPERAAQMGRNGRRAVMEEYNWETQRDKLLGLYDDLIGAPRS